MLLCWIPERHLPQPDRVRRRFCCCSARASATRLIPSSSANRMALGSNAAGGFSSDQSISNRAIERARRSPPSAPIHHAQFAPGNRRARHRARRWALYLGQRRQHAFSTAWRDCGPATSAMAARSLRRRLTTRWSSFPSTIRSSRRRTPRSSPCRASSPSSPRDNLNQVFFGSSGSEVERHRDPSDPALLGPQGRAQAAHHHLAQERLSRLDHRRRLDGRHGACP